MGAQSLQGAMTSNGQKDRVEGRTRAVVRAQMRDSQPERDICIIDISTRGLLATAARPPKRGEFVEIVIGRNRLAGQVRWASERRFGLSLQDRVSVIAIMEGGDANVALARSPAAKAARSSIFASLLGNSNMFGRLLQLAAIGVAVAGAGLAIVSLTTQGFEPVQQAFSEASSR